MKFTKKIKEFIYDKLSEGFNVAQMCRLWPDKLPHPKSIYRKQIEDAEFREKMSVAHAVHFIGMIDKYQDFSCRPASEVFPELDFKEAEATMKRASHSMEVAITRMSGSLSDRFDKTQKVEVKGLESPQMVVLNYAVEPEKLVNPVLPLSKD